MKIEDMLVVEEKVVGMEEKVVEVKGEILKGKLWKSRGWW